MDKMKMQRSKRNFISCLSISALSIILLTMMPTKVKAQTLTLVGGRMDGFDTSDGLEEASPSDGLVLFNRNRLEDFFDMGFCDRVPQVCEVKNFDEDTFDKTFLHTFNFDDLAGEITEAQLEIRARGNGSNDTISLFFIDSQGNLISEGSPRPVWSSFFGSGNSSEGLLDSVWGGGSDETFFLDLAELPLAPERDPELFSTNLLPALNSMRFLDIFVQDDSEVDYVKLNLTVESTVPEPSLILGLGLFTGLWFLSKKT